MASKFTILQEGKPARRDNKIVLYYDDTDVSAIAEFAVCSNVGVNIRADLSDGNSKFETITIESGEKDGIAQSVGRPPWYGVESCVITSLNTTSDECFDYLY